MLTDPLVTAFGIPPKTMEQNPLADAEQMHIMSGFIRKWAVPLISTRGVYYYISCIFGIPHQGLHLVIIDKTRLSELAQPRRAAQSRALRERRSLISGRPRLNHLRTSV